jgi:hypothetical protein
MLSGCGRIREKPGGDFSEFLHGLGEIRLPVVADADGEAREIVGDGDECMASMFS